LAWRFARAGYGLIIAARSQDALEDLAVEVERECQVPVHALVCDLASASGPRALHAHCRQHQLDVAAVINNAAMLPYGEAAALSSAAARDLINLSIRATTELALAFIPDMVARKSGAIINVSSLAGYYPIDGGSLYSASKAYLTMLSQGLDRELAGTGVACIAVTLGPVRTDMIAKQAAAGARMGWLHRLAMPPESAAEIIFDGFVAGRRRFSTGLLGATVEAAVRVLPSWVVRPIANQLV
jgi:uncharacterized protein